ncbi:hypothetical protein HW450_11405 [Corynebacterium hindlerae]|uniref:Uncharacterized protein n=1 Tax=Corynebacterium hindlerae TaxID=699041 RepID=A0A7G5FE85_9CORY|nr:hypothetical protein [Corynebacterium hindlerae]QMV84926.1 hypothetical protein HW450_11405 [Corynebacterium hindlerae]QTH59176.1 hypothetical protein J5O04_10245 [Corynebacterium hindlerae]
MTAMQWGKRQDHAITLSEDGREVTTFQLENDTTATAEVAGRTWSFELHDATARATCGDVEWVAEAEKGFKRSKRFVARMGERSIDFINEQKSDWIIDENDVKLGQFTGANHGVRHVAVDFEPDAKLDEEQRVFLAWLSRIALEQRLVGSSWILTVILLILSPFILLYFFL